MQIGDPKKAVILLLVALIVLGVAATRIIPHGPKQIAAEVTRADGAQAISAQKQTVATLPSTLTSEPFRKPNVAAQRKSPTENSANTPHKLGLSSPGHSPVIVANIEPYASPRGLPGLDRPSENTSSDRKVKQEDAPTMTLTGVVSVTRRIAIVTVSTNADEPLKCSVGSTIEGYRVTALDDASMVLTKGKKHIKLTVGIAVPL